MIQTDPDNFHLNQPPFIYSRPYHRHSWTLVGGSNFQLSAYILKPLNNQDTAIVSHLINIIWLMYSDCLSYAVFSLATPKYNDFNKTYSVLEKKKKKKYRDLKSY